MKNTPLILIAALLLGAPLLAQNGNTDKSRKESGQTQPMRTTVPQPSPGNGGGKQTPTPDADGLEAPQFKPANGENPPLDFEWNDQTQRRKPGSGGEALDAVAGCHITITDAQTNCITTTTYSVTFSVQLEDVSSTYSIVDGNGDYLGDGVYCGPTPCNITLTGIANSGNQNLVTFQIWDNFQNICTSNLWTMNEPDCCPKLENPEILLVGTDCEGDVAQLDVDVVDADNGSLSWYSTDDVINPIPDPSSVVLVHSGLCGPEVNEFYAVFETSTDGCDDFTSETVSITVYPDLSAPTIETSAGGCIVSLQGPCDLSYEWDDGTSTGSGPYQASIGSATVDFTYNYFSGTTCSGGAINGVPVNCTCPIFDINYSLPPSGVALNDLWNATLSHNQAATLDVEVQLIVTNDLGGEVYHASTQTIGIPVGQSINLAAHSSNLESVAVSQAVGQAFARLGILPSGNYTVELAVTPNGNSVCTQTESRTISDMQRLMPPIPVAPYMGERVEVALPVFAWNASGPVEANHYVLKIAEIIGNQSPQQAISANTLWHRHKINPRTQLEYPGYARPLESGKRYAWQLTANLLGADSITVVESAESEIWQFAYVGQNAGGEAGEDGATGGKTDLLCGEIGGQTRLRVFGAGGKGTKKIKATLKAANSTTGLPWTCRVRYELLVNGGEYMRLGELAISGVEPVAVNEFFEDFFTGDGEKGGFAFGGVELRVYDVYTIPQNPGLLPDEICLELSVRDAGQRYGELEEELRSNAIYPNEAAFTLLYHLNPSLYEEVPLSALRPLAIPEIDLRKRNAIAAQKYLPTKRTDQSLNPALGTNKGRFERNMGGLSSGSRRVVEEVVPSGVQQLRDLEEFLRQLQEGGAVISNPSAIMLDAQVDYLNDLLEKLNSGKSLDGQEREDLRDLILGMHYMAESAETSIKSAMGLPGGLPPGNARASIGPDVAIPLPTEAGFARPASVTNRGETDEVFVNIGTYVYPGCEPKCELFFNYIPKGLYSVRDRYKHVMKAFDAQTTNTHDYIPVGYYKIWLADGQGNEMPLAKSRNELKIRIAAADERVICRKASTSEGNANENDYHVNCPGVPVIMTAPPVVEDIYELNVVLFVE